MTAHEVNAEKQRTKRAERTAAGKCINGSTPATNGRKCLRCSLVHRLGVAVARKLNEYRHAPVCNPKFGALTHPIPTIAVDLPTFIANFFGVYPTNVARKAA